MQISLQLQESPKSQESSRVASDCSVDRTEFRNWKVNAESVAEIRWLSAPNPLLRLGHGQVPLVCLQDHDFKGISLDIEIRFAKWPK